MRYYHKATDDHATYASNAAWMLLERLMDFLNGDLELLSARQFRVLNFNHGPVSTSMLNLSVIVRFRSGLRAHMPKFNIHSYIHRTIHDPISHHLPSCKTCMFASYHLRNAPPDNADILMNTHKNPCSLKDLNLHGQTLRRCYKQITGFSSRRVRSPSGRSPRSSAPTGR